MNPAITSMMMPMKISIAARIQTMIRGSTMIAMPSKMKIAPIKSGANPMRRLFIMRPHVSAIGHIGMERVESSAIVVSSSS